jgi:hypothetical protein
VADAPAWWFRAPDAADGTPGGCSRSSAKYVEGGRPPNTGLPPPSPRGREWAITTPSKRCRESAPNRARAKHARSEPLTLSGLSGGEKTKLALAQLVADRHNLLLLDEPTNNLDPPSRSAIGIGLASWPGSIVLVSHDAEFVDALAPDIALLLPDGTLDYWSNDLLALVPLA